MRGCYGVVLSFCGISALSSIAHAALPTAKALKNARPPVRSLHTRGVDIELPLRIRILLEEKRPEQGKVILNGTLLRTAEGAVIGDNLTCEYQDAFLKEKSLLRGPAWTDASGFWNCQGKNFKQVLSGPLKLSAEAGFIKADKIFLRDDVELHPQGHNLLVVNAVTLRHYLAGLVNKEMRSDFPPEAVKAQIIAARSYAVATAADRRKNGFIFDLFSTQADQVYAGAEPEDPQSFKMERETRGYVLMHMEQVLKAYYHAANGGFSETVENVWGTENQDKDRRAFAAKESPFDSKIDFAKWRITLTPAVGKRWAEIGELTEIEVLSSTSGQRVQTLRIAGTAGSRIWTGAEFRRKLGNDWIKSTLFKITKNPQGIGWILEGAGWGHGVGLSQWGARAMARAGKKHQEILEFYYPSANLRRLDFEEGDSSVDRVMQVPALAR